MAKAKYFTQNNEKVYPISHTKAVYDGNGKVLEDRLTEDETAISSLQTDVKGKANKTDVDNKLNSNSAISDTTVAFTEASVRENIVSNEKSSTLFGKVQKWFSDLKKVAFTGSYNDLIDTPSNATTTINGLMSSSDKIKLNGISSNANNYIHPTTSGNKHIPSGGSSGQILKWSADGTAIWGTEKTYSNATTSTSGLMSASDKTDLDACVETLSADASMFLSSIKSPAPAEFEFVETLSLSNLTLTNDVTFSNTDLFNGYASLTEITSEVYDMSQKNVDNGLDFVYYMAHDTSSKRFDFSATDPLYISSSQGGKWYYDGNENTNYGTKLNFGDGDYVHIAEVYDDAMELKGSNIHLGIETSKAVWLQSSNSSTTKYKVVGTSTGYNTKIHVATSQPSTMSVGDIWFKISS